MNLASLFDQFIRYAMSEQIAPSVPAALTPASIDSNIDNQLQVTAAHQQLQPSTAANQMWYAGCLVLFVQTVSHLLLMLLTT